MPLVDPNARPTAARSTSLLPPSFGGWQKAKTKAGADPAQADAAYGPLFKEYGFTDFEDATYTREGRTIQVKAARFADAGGAYGAFTFYKRPQMLVEKIGDQGASLSDLILFYRGNVLVKAQLDQVTAMSAAELRELAGELPPVHGAAANLPALPGYLPRGAYVKNSAKYAAGPVGLSLIGAPVSAEMVDFSRGAEVVLGKYDTGSGEAVLVLISYPTPQIAGERMRAFEDLIQKNPQATDGLRMVRRTGPIVVLAAGAVTPSEAKSLLAAVNYDANVTWNEATFLGAKNNIGNLVVAALMLAGIILLFALAAGVAFGGVRLLLKRFYPNRVFDRSGEMDIIQLKLTE